MDTTSAVEENICRYCFPQANVWVAYSGGLDSTVLLYGLNALRRRISFTLVAVHIHHGLNPKAEDWLEHCSAFCQKLDVALTTHRLNLCVTETNIEARARSLRYAYFASLLQSRDILMTGHHQDDQAETLLLQLVRGAGPKGLSAMPAESSFADGRLIRPFLTLSRATLLTYARDNNLVWIEDESNQDTRFSRNFMRQKIVPQLKTRWPSVTETISRSAQHCAETEELLQGYAAKLLLFCQGAGSTHLLVSQLKSFTFAQQKLVVRHWLWQQNFLLPGELKLRNLLHTFLTAAEDKNPMITWDDVEVRRYRDDIFALKKLSAHDASQTIVWTDLSQSLKITSLKMSLSASKKNDTGIRILPNQRCDIRFRCKLRALKKRFQAWNVPPWLRDRVPLLYIDGELAAVIGYGISKKFAVLAGEIGWVITIKNEAPEGSAR